MKYILEFEEKDLKPTKSFELKKELNPDIWDDMKMKSDIREKLIEISNEFISNLHGEFDVSDIILTGSLSSYNWSEYSDFDVHIKIDFSEINDDQELVGKYLSLLSKRFNNEYDITILDYDVEIYIEDISEVREHVNGVYSILKDKWVNKPTVYDKEVDTLLIEEKAINLMEQIDELEERTKMDNIDLEEAISDVNKIWSKIKKMRKDGISSPDGELSVGNLVFKYLRRNEYISKVIDMKKKLVEKKYSI